MKTASTKVHDLFPAAPAAPSPGASYTLTIAEAAALARVSRLTIYRMARRGQIPTVKFGRRLMVPRARFLAYLEGQS